MRRSGGVGAVGLTVTDNGLVVEGLGAEVVEGCAGGDEGVGDGLAGGVADAELDAGWVDSLFLREVLASVEGTFGGGGGLLLRIRVADDDEAGVGLLIEGEGDVVEAALGFVIDADGATLITREAQAAEGLGLRNDGCGRRGDGDFGGGLCSLAEVVYRVAGDGDDAGAEAGGDETRGWSSAGDDAGGRGVGIGERAVLWTGADGADGDVCAGDGGAGVGGAGEGWWFEGLDGEGSGAGGLLACFGTFFDVSCDNVVAGSEIGGIYGGFGASGENFAAVGRPGVDRGLLGVGVQRGGGDFDGIAGEDAGGLSAAAEHDGIWGFDVAEAGYDAAGELEVTELTEAALLAGGEKEWAVDDLGVLVVGLNGADGETVVEQREDVVDTSAAGDAPAPV